MKKVLSLLLAFTLTSYASGAQDPSKIDDDVDITSTRQGMNEDEIACIASVMVISPEELLKQHKQLSSDLNQKKDSNSYQRKIEINRTNNSQQQPKIEINRSENQRKSEEYINSKALEDGMDPEEYADTQQQAFDSFNTIKDSFKIAKQKQKEAILELTRKKNKPQEDQFFKNILPNSQENDFSLSTNLKKESRENIDDDVDITSTRQGMNEDEIACIASVMGISPEELLKQQQQISSGLNQEEHFNQKNYKHKNEQCNDIAVTSNKVNTNTDTFMQKGEALEHSKYKSQIELFMGIFKVCYKENTNSLKDKVSDVENTELKYLLQSDKGEILYQTEVSIEKCSFQISRHQTMPKKRVEVIFPIEIEDDNKSRICLEFDTKSGDFPTKIVKYIPFDSKLFLHSSYQSKMKPVGAFSNIRTDKELRSNLDIVQKQKKAKENQFFFGNKISLNSQEDYFSLSIHCQDLPLEVDNLKKTDTIQHLKEAVCNQHYMRGSEYEIQTLDNEKLEAHQTLEFYGINHKTASQFFLMLVFTSNLV